MSEGGEGQKLLVIILDEPQAVDDILSGFLELGVPGGTVVESRGMGQIIRQEMPVFAGLASLFPEHSGNRMIFSVVSESVLEQVFQLVEEVAAQIGQAGAAVCFTLPVEQFRHIRH
jgi:nitrogen regulatory protein PII